MISLILHCGRWDQHVTQSIYNNNDNKYISRVLNLSVSNLHEAQSAVHVQLNFSLCILSAAEQGLYGKPAEKCFDSETFTKPTMCPHFVCNSHCLSLIAFSLSSVNDTYW